MVLNNRGNIAVQVLVAGVFIVCMVAMASFLYAQTKFVSGFTGINLAEQISSDVEQFYTYVNLEYSCKEAAVLIDASYDAGENKLVINKVVKESSGFFNKKESVKVEINRTIVLGEELCPN
jgi:hypothetical protein